MPVGVEDTLRAFLLGATGVTKVLGLAVPGGIRVALGALGIASAGLAGLAQVDDAGHGSGM